jgi:hypothetical protein
MGSPTYFPTAYFGGTTPDDATITASTNGRRKHFVELYATALDYELGTNDSAVLFTTARRKASINEGLREFADLTECWVRESTITVYSTQALYNLTSTAVVPAMDFLRLTADGPTYRYTDAANYVTYIAGDDLPRRDPPWLNAHEPGWPASTGTTYPQSWYLEARDGSLNVGLYPPPSLSTGSTAALLLPYIARPSSLIDDTSVPFTDTNTGLVRTDLMPFHQATVHYAAHRLELLRKDTEASDRQLQKFLGYVQRYIQAKRKPAGETIRPARSYFSKARARRLGSDDLTGLLAPWWR